MKSYTVRQLATLAGVSVRTLHHYDHIGLLRPSARTEAGYRLYGEADLLRLQQILFYKELDVALDDIRGILDRPGFDLVDALGGHRRMIEQRIARLTRLLGTIDKTILSLKEDTMTLTDADLYEGFSPEETAQLKRYEQEARTMYDPKLMAESDRKVRSMTKAQWQAIGQEGEQVTRDLAALMDRQPGDAEVQKAIARHHAWIGHFFTASAEVYSGLGQGYAQHPGFRAYYDRFAPGLADFMNEAMAYYAEHSL
jgi:DNA-binding transcriptional MerR regulator